MALPVDGGAAAFAGFAAASVWISFGRTRLTTPLVTVPPSP